MLASLLSFIPLALLIAAVVWYFKARDKRPIKLPIVDVAAAKTPSAPIGFRVAVKAGNAAIKWSGQIDGELPIKSLTGNQGRCLSDATTGVLVIRDSDISDRRIYDRDESGVMHADRTVDSLVKHGFLAPDGRGAYVCTDRGARAYETLQVRG